jgi:arylsulfatase A
VCSPTRAALLTGQYQQRNGMDEVILVRQRERGLNTRGTLVPQLLKTAGYATGIFGKWHLGFQPQFLPTRRGFDEFKGFLSGNIDYFAHIHRSNEPDLWDREKSLTESRYMTDFIAEESMAFIDRHGGRRPFSLFAASNAVHDPFQGPGDRDSAGNFEVTAQKNRNRAVYQALESLDLNIGRLLDHLKAGRQEENALVFFMSDNGGVPGSRVTSPSADTRVSCGNAEFERLSWSAGRDALKPAAVATMR